jgi:HTH-type transcriptional regulator / antitoxin HigA
MASATLDYPRLLGQKRPAVIRTKVEHKRRLAEFEQLVWRENLTSAEKQYCELLAVLIEDYEKKAFSLKAASSPIELLKELMSANQLQQKDLLDIFKHKGLISEVLSGKRPLSVAHIRGLAERFRISPEAFI